MMKYFILLFVYLTVQILNVESRDYCENELNYLCEGMKHVGCAASDEYFQPWIDSRRNFRKLQMTDEYRQIILQALNSAKNRVAGGEYGMTGYKKASDLPVMQWDDEFELLTDLTVFKVPFNKSLLSCSSDQNLQPTFLVQFQRGSNLEETELSFIQHASYSIGNFTTSQNLEWYASYYAYAKRLGCNIGEFEEEREGVWYHIRILHCMNDALPNDLPKYTFGEECSACPNNVECDNEFIYLCKRNDDEDGVLKNS